MSSRVGADVEGPDLVERKAALTIGAQTTGKTALDILRARSAVVAAIGLTILLIVGFSTPGFFTVFNLVAILSSAAVVGVIAIGETVIMIGGSLFSLSLATTSAVSAMAFMATLHRGLTVATLAALALGVSVNAVQGVAVGLWRANPIIVTIAAGGLLTGIVAWLTGDKTIFAPFDETSYQALGRQLFHVPVPAIVFLLLGAGVALLLRYTVFGMQLYMMGDNRAAAKAAGLPIGWLTIRAFALAGFCAGIAGVLMAAINQEGALGLAGNTTYLAITAVLVGGTAVTGGRGSVTRSIIGALVATAISNLAILRGYGSGGQLITQGVLVLTVVMLFQSVRRGDA
jgi:ribose transport system permease protein